MATATQLQRSHLQRPIRALYIKKRLLTDNTFDSEWTRIDNFGGRDRIVRWGSFTKSINSTPTDIGNYNLTAINMEWINDDGIFSIENTGASLWSIDDLGNVYARFLSRIKIEVSYRDTDNTEKGLQNIFEGFIYKVMINNDTTLSVTLISYLYLLQNIDISRISITSTNVSGILNDIFSDETIAKVMNFSTFDADNDVEIDTSLLAGSVWAVIKELCKISNAVPVLNEDTLSIVNRKRDNNTIDFSFRGLSGRGENSNILGISGYDDDGIDRLVNYFYDTSDTDVFSQIQDDLRSNKAFDQSIGLDLSIVNNDTDKKALLNTLLREFSKEKPSLMMRTTFCGTFVDVVSLIDIEYHNVSCSSATWGAFKYGDNVEWGEYMGGIKIDPGSKWFITSLTNDIDNFTSSIKAEKASIELV